MATRAPERIALISLKPRFADAILAGTKQVEFRKRRLSADVSHVVMYVTQPVGRLVGFFTVSDVVEDEPERLWRRFNRVAGISREDFFAYYSGRDKAVGIRIGQVTRLSRQLGIETLGADVVPPQGVTYFTGDRLASLMR